MKLSINFDVPLLDVNGKAVKGSNASDKQVQKIRELQLISAHRDTSLSNGTDALSALESLREEVSKDERLGDACVTALMFPDEKADGKQVRTRLALIDKIQISPEVEEYAEIELNDDQRKWISEALERAYLKKAPYLYFAAYKLVNNDADIEEEKD